ncbi:LOW QUALITY PROTEIN: hypothetical protein PHMEG_0005100 [Phytophthora megakarya]|uniref:Ubiquitin-like protease family profile domain-containing protein n=1 Tax=Phytophthora megakarya TaxID=4795 RepID=A0A225WSA5_9STRA|nr:LOW QUALITY PROTEIN: hypothetical protein PHMEG_0005100 [Phytophthora megakarya]
MASGGSGRGLDSVGGSGDDDEARSATTVVGSCDDNAGRGDDDAGAVSGDIDELENSEDDDSGAVSVVMEVPVLWHAEWASWQTYFAEYCARTMQVLPVRETMSRAERNRRLKRTKKGADDSQLVPEGFDPYQRVYICTHGWKKRKSRSDGARPRQHIRLTDCPFRFCVQWNLSRRELQVKNEVFWHNHQVSAAAYATYPGSRGVEDPLVVSRVDGMLAVGAKRSKIYDYLLDHDENVIQVDVDNLVRANSASVASKDDDDATARELAAFAAADPENISSVAVTDADESGVISLASAHMRRVYSRFSELLLVDCSHKTNRYNYQLLTFMVMNEFGEGAVVQHSMIEANGDWHMEKAIDHFKRLHPTRIDLLRVIVVDKDLNEIRVLESNFPGARVLICHFHVIKYLKEKRSKPESAHDALRGICERVGFNDFFSYFERNWDSSQDRWVMYRRAHLEHFKNHTNNRLESFFGKLKDGVNGSMSMANCVKGLVAHDRRVQNEYQYRISRIGTYTNSNYDEEMSTVLRFTTHYVASQIETQYSTALEKGETYRFEKHPSDSNVVVVGGKFTEHDLNVNTWWCDCAFACSMKLPCRHAIAYRKVKQLPGTLIPFIRIDSRWTSPTPELKKVKQFTLDLFDTIGADTHKRLKMSRSEKHRGAVRITQVIASELADIDSDTEYNEMSKFLENMWRNIRQGKRIAVAKLQSDSAPRPRQSVTKKEIKAVKAEFGISSSEDEATSSGADADDGEEESVANHAEALPTIRINPKAKKVGAPKKPKKKSVATEKAERKWFEAAEQGRKTAGEVTLVALLDALDLEQSGLAETQLSGVVVKYSDADRKKPKYKKMKKPVLILDPFYLLPSNLLDACIRAFPLSNTKETAIAIDSSQPEVPAQVKGVVEAVEAVQIKDVGMYSRTQIETFKRVKNLKTCVQLGIDMHKWLTEQGIPSLPAEYHQYGNKVAAEILSTYPHKRIEGLPEMTDFNYSMLYRATPPTWLTDASIRALCLRLAKDYPACRFAGFQSAAATTKRTRASEATVMERETRDRVLAQVAEPGVDTVMLPLNFSNAHWCCLVVKVSAKRIYYYDPLNQAPYRNAAQAVATHLKVSGLKDFDVIPQNNPIQFDAYSCGVFVSWMFIRQVVPGPGQDMSSNALTRRRFELFYYMLTGRLLPYETAQNAQGDAAEEKGPLPATTEERMGLNEDCERKMADEPEEVPATQVAE